MKIENHEELLKYNKTHLKKSPKISLVVPCYNEESNVVPFFEAIESLFAGQGILSDDGAQYELIYVNDGSTDGTAEKITAIAENKIMGGGYSRERKRHLFLAEFRQRSRALCGASECDWRLRRHPRCGFAAPCLADSRNVRRMEKRLRGR